MENNWQCACKLQYLLGDKRGFEDDLQNTTQKTMDRATWTSLKTNSDLQNTTQKTMDRATWTSLKTNNDLQNTTQKTKKIEQHEPH
jgi:hypothetical protein